MSDEGTPNVNNNRQDSAWVNRSSLDRQGRLLVPRPPREKAPFQRLMDEMKEGNTGDALGLGTPRAQEAGSSHQPVQPVAHEDQRPSPFREELQKRYQESERKPDGKKSTSASEAEKPKAKIAEQKVVSRGPLAQRHREGNGKGAGKEGFQSYGNPTKTFVALAQLKAFQKGKIQELGSAFVQNLKITATVEKNERTPLVFSKVLLDQIVQYVRIMTRADGEKEMDVSLHEKVFKGLRLRVAMARGKAEVTFLTHSEEVRKLFLSHRREITEALKEKEIEVKAINVIILQRG